MRATTLVPDFVDLIPDALREGTLYICIPYATVAHRCCCGCGEEAITPLAPTDWKLTFDGRTVSLYPSIGNWSFACRSHYWIRHNRVEWAPTWSKARIDRARAEDREAKATPMTPDVGDHTEPTGNSRASVRETLLRLWRRISR